MSGAHSKGPWFVGTQNDGLYIIDGPPSPAPYDGPIPKNYGPNVIATPNWRSPECKANARLIASAPELLATLEWIARVCREEMPLEYVGKMRVIFQRNVAEAAEKAIAKAVQS